MSRRDDVFLEVSVHPSATPGSGYSQVHQTRPGAVQEADFGSGHHQFVCNIKAVNMSKNKQ